MIQLLWMYRQNDPINKRIFYFWADKENGPKTVNDVKLINAGKILENNKTLAESRLPVAEVPGGVITMHVVVRPPLSDKNSGNSMPYVSDEFSTFKLTALLPLLAASFLKSFVNHI
jgi:hypothetical protein